MMNRRPKRGYGAAAAMAISIGAMLGVGPLQGGLQPQSDRSSASDAQWYGCVSRPSDDRELAFAVRGKVGEVFVAPGDRVDAGDLIIRLTDTVQRHTVELARLRGEDKSRVQLAERNLAYRQEELKQSEASAAQGGANQADLREARFRQDQAELELERFRTELTEAQVAHQREQARLDEMSISSPINGIVLDVQKHVGESTDEQTTVVTVIKTDPLWLDVSVPTQIALGIKVGQRAQVRWQDIDVSPMTGRVIFRSPAGHAGARQLLVRVEVANPPVKDQNGWITQPELPSGLHGDIKFLAPEVAGSRPESVRPGEG